MCRLGLVLKFFWVLSWDRCRHHIPESNTTTPDGQVDACWMCLTLSAVMQDVHAEDDAAIRFIDFVYDDLVVCCRLISGSS